MHIVSFIVLAATVKTPYSQLCQRELGLQYAAEARNHDLKLIVGDKNVWIVE